MKRYCSLLLLLLFVANLYSCKKKSNDDEEPYNCATCARTPQALAAHDNSALGLYKGVIIGSSGVITFNLANGGNTMTALMTIDGVTVNLSANITYTAGSALVGAFTGTMNGQPVTINFSVGASGGTPTVTSSNIPGHANAVFEIYKETSNSLIEAFEGTYDKPASGGGRETGTFNVLIARALNGLRGVVRKTGATTFSRFTGTVTNNNIALNTGNTNTVTGTISGDAISGISTDSNGQGTFTGRRTL
ncbi:hypothetical protein [Flaviaesturariibacter amylovorans]|uniref:CHRD domain-containing protein n=1 Tax=Flaviaesturariibacter amylovorans TaxID=1084520 RepID=A0ABP8GA04_9BACT